MSDDGAKIRRRMALESVPKPAPALDDDLTAVKAAARVIVNAWIDEQIELVLAGRRRFVSNAEIQAKCLSALTEAFAQAVVGHVFGDIGKPRP